MTTLKIYKIMPYDNQLQEFKPTKDEKDLIFILPKFDLDLLDYIPIQIDIIRYINTFVIASPLEFDREIEIPTKALFIQTICKEVKIITKFSTPELGLSDNEIGIL